MKRYILITVGLVATALAFLGVLLPILPAVPFLIVALWAFARSHDKLHKWLMKVPVFKHTLVHIQHFEKHRAITREVKILSQVSTWGSFAFVSMIPEIHSFLKAFVLVAAISCSAAMYIFPTLTEHQKKSD